ncbi:hypothetical protein F4819DRAFT_478315 [Hypoxylon fuscum]|nr:hypothetical protein F4819DRAFT_478315 [Hypoxylon fuscum]
MQTRFALVEALLEVQTPDAVQAALDHLMKMFRIRRNDNMGIQSLIPAVMLRLGKDQECYDFVKWHHTCDPDGTYDWSDPDLPYLDVKDADVIEPLLKFRLLLDLQYLEDKPGTVPMKTLSSVTLTRLDIILLCQHYTPRIRELKRQLLELYNCVNESNRFFWPMLADTSNHFGNGLIVQYASAAWVETPGAIDFIRALIKVNGQVEL